jgi:hypothetical protein
MRATLYFLKSKCNVQIENFFFYVRDDRLAAVTVNIKDEKSVKLVKEFVTKVIQSPVTVERTNQDDYAVNFYIEDYAGIEIDGIESHRRIVFSDGHEDESEFSLKKIAISEYEYGRAILLEGNNDQDVPKNEILKATKNLNLQRAWTVGFYSLALTFEDTYIFSTSDIHYVYNQIQEQRF